MNRPLSVTVLHSTKSSASHSGWAWSSAISLWNHETIHEINYDPAEGKDEIPAELYKAAGPEAINVFHDIISHIWEEDKMPEDFCNSLIIALYKNKGSKANCENYRGISVLSITGKILDLVILNWLHTMSEANLPEDQCGCCPGCSTVDMIFSVRQVQEKCIEQKLDLYF